MTAPPRLCVNGGPALARDPVHPKRPAALASVAIRSRREDTRRIVHSRSGGTMSSYPTHGAPRSQDSLKIQCNRSTVVHEAAHWVVKMKRSQDLQGFLVGSSPSETQRITKWTRCRPPRSEALLWDRKVIARSVGPGAVKSDTRLARFWRRRARSCTRRDGGTQKYKNDV